MTEAEVERAAFGWFESLNFTVRTGTEIDDAGERADLNRVLLEGRLAAALHRLNPKLPHNEVEQVVRTLSRPPHPTLIQNNRWFHEQVTGGVEVTYRDSATGEMRGGRAKLIDFEDPTQNELLVVRQLQVVGPSGKTIRPDLTVFLNGMPIALIELKDPADTQADLPAAIGQLHRYMERAPTYSYPMFC